MTEYTIERIIGKSDLETLKVNGLFLHSKYNPIREANEFAEKHYKAGNTHILFGYGKGYIAEALQARFVNGEKLLVIEPILKGSKVDIQGVEVLEEDSLGNIETYLIRNIPVLNNVQIVCSPNYDKICPELYKETLLILKNRLAINQINENTINTMAHEWQSNYLFNIKHALNDQSIEALYKYSTAPVVIASGGPSLTKQLPLLKKIRNQIILIASGSTVNTLLHESIEPDFVVSIDSQEANYNHFKDTCFTHAKLIYNMYSHYKIREKFSSDSYYFLNKGEEELLSHVNSIVDDHAIALHGGGSVANFAFTIANYISNGPVALIGQDLAYTNMQTHAENNKHFHRITVEEVKRKSMFWTKGYNNDEVLTDHSFFAMKETFEQLVENIEVNEHVFNCTEGGIKLEKFKQIPFSEFIDKFIGSNCEISTIIRHNKYVNYKKIIEKFSNELKLYERIKKLLNENLRLLVANKSNIQFSSSILKKLDKNDALIEKYRNVTAVQVIMNPLSIKIFKYFKPKNNETPEERYTRVYEQSKMLYKGYLEAIDITEKYILELCEMLRKEEGEFE